MRHEKQGHGVSPAAKAEEPHAKGRANPSQLLQSNPSVVNAAKCAGGKISGGATSSSISSSSPSVSLQWLTPRRDGAADGGGGEAPSRSQRGGSESFAQPPVTPAAQGGRSFSSLFSGPGQQQQQQPQPEELPQRSGGSGVAGAGFAQGSGQVDGRGDWPEAGRGPPTPREHKKIFDHKTGKMRDVEVSRENEACGMGALIPSYGFDWLRQQRVVLV